MSILADLFEFSDEEKLFLRVLNEFFIRENVERVMLEAKEFPHDLYKKMAGLGLIGVRIPPEYGGQGGNSVMAGLTYELIGYYGAPFTLTPAAAELIYFTASESQREMWLPKMLQGDMMVGIANTEPGCGSDAAAIQTTAIKKGDEYVINGEKSFITGVQIYDAFIVTAKTDPDKGFRGVSMFMIPMDLPGIEKTVFETYEGELPMTGGLGGFKLSDVHVPKENLIGEENKGFYYLMGIFDLLRISAACLCIGLAGYALDKTIEYVKQRHAFGRPIGKFEAVQFRISEDITLLTAAKIFSYSVLRKVDRGERVTKEAAMLKWWVPQLTHNIISNCIQNHGAIGITKETGLLKRMYFTRSLWIADGTSDIQKIIIAREILGKEFLPYR